MEPSYLRIEAIKKLKDYSPTKQNKYKRIFKIILKKFIFEGQYLNNEKTYSSHPFSTQFTKNSGLSTISMLLTNQLTSKKQCIQIR